jgi:hypothetical protein
MSQEEAPSPELVAAWVVLEWVAVERAPWWAAHWLVDGYDGAALRELAGLDGRDTRAVRDLLPLAFAEMSVVLPSVPEAASVVSFDDLARRCLAGAAGERWVVQVVEETAWRTGYDPDVLALPLGRVYGIDDEWDGGWGRSVEELRALVRAACAAQLAR